MMKMMMARMECTENENDQLKEAFSGTFSNGERTEEKVDNGKETINNLLEKMNTMERRNEERMTKLMKEHRSELKRARNNNNEGGGNDRYRTNGDDYDERDRKRARFRDFDERKNFKTQAEKYATNRLKWEKRLEEKLDKPGSGWANKRAQHDPDMINWGGYCHTHGYYPIGKGHDSAKCNRTADRHDKTATRTNRKGGRETNKPL